MRLIDINDNPPEFEHSVYTTAVREDTSVGSSVIQVFATSRDTGINAEIMYDIIAGNEQGKFRMDSKTGSHIILFENLMQDRDMGTQLDKYISNK